jgi:hypothetical protein
MRAFLESLSWSLPFSVTFISTALQSSILFKGLCGETEDRVGACGKHLLTTWLTTPFVIDRLPQDIKDVNENSMDIAGIRTVMQDGFTRIDMELLRVIAQGKPRERFQRARIGLQRKPRHRSCCSSSMRT